MQVGTIHDTSNYGSLKIIEYIGYYNVAVQFIGTGYRTTAQAGTVRCGGVKDKLMPTVFDVGFIGEGNYKPSIKGKMTKQYKTWQNMLERCYDDKYQARCPTYVGCSVVDEWHDFQNFAKWFDDHYVDGYQLDKDIKVKGNKLYSPDNCMFVSHADNIIEARAKYYRFTSPQGELVEIYNLASFCRDNGLSRGAMSQVHLGKLNHHKQWKVAK